MSATTRPYVATPIAVLCRPNWPARVRRIEDLADEPVWDPARLFTSTAAWLQEWPRLLGSITGLILVPDTDSSIGAGCLREISDVLGLDKPVWIYESETLVTWGEVQVRPIARPTRFKVATVHRAEGPQKKPARDRP
jgi:hypothetical protein